MAVETKFLIPLKGLIVRDPHSMTPLAEGGEYKPWYGPAGRYWRRRVKDKSVTVGKPQKKEVKKFYEGEK